MDLLSGNSQDMSAPAVGKDKNNRAFSLFQIGLIPIRRHIKIRSNANPFDPAFDKYFETRRKNKQKMAKLSHQKCIFVKA